MLALPLLTLQAPVHAQEHFNQGTVGAEASWTAMKNLVTAADMKAEVAQIMATAAKDCGLKGMLFAPGLEGSDANGCKHVVDEALTAVVDKIIACGKDRKFYNGTKCISSPVNQAAPVDNYNPPNGHGDGPGGTGAYM